MWNILNPRRHHVPSARLTRVALVGDHERRAHVKAMLGTRVEYAGELASDRRIRLLNEIAVDVVLLDCGSNGVNPFTSLPALSGLPGSPRVVALTDRFSMARLNEQVLCDLGADVVVDFQDAPALARAAGAAGTLPERNCSTPPVWTTVWNTSG